MDALSHARIPIIRIEGKTEIGVC
ncbi:MULTISPECIES: hypothetical protein [Siminovitchia]|nr:hypothetical protein [Siminovitchia fortis]WHY83751.1 hypothetical protein QNH23_11895 [Siminovitchia fortis]